MQRLLSVRITRWELKGLYIIGVWLIGWPIVWLLPDALAVVGGTVNLAITVAGFWYGTRVFRGRGEPVEPPRPWWKATAWPKLSRVFGSIAAVAALLMVFYFVAGLVGFGTERTLAIPPTDYLMLGLPYALIAVVYLNSAVRMRGQQPPPRASSKNTGLARRPVKLD